MINQFMNKIRVDCAERYGVKTRMQVYCFVGSYDYLDLCREIANSTRWVDTTTRENILDRILLGNIICMPSGDFDNGYYLTTGNDAKRLSNIGC